MFSLDNSNYKEEIESFLASNGKINTLPPQENPRRISAKPRNLDDEDDEIFISSFSDVAGGKLFRTGSKRS